MPESGGARVCCRHRCRDRRVRHRNATRSMTSSSPPQEVRALACAERRWSSAARAPLSTIKLTQRDARAMAQGRTLYDLIMTGRLEPRLPGTTDLINRPRRACVELRSGTCQFTRAPLLIEDCDAVLRNVRLTGDIPPRQTWEMMQLRAPPAGTEERLLAVSGHPAAPRCDTDPSHDAEDEVAVALAPSTAPRVELRRHRRTGRSMKVRSAGLSRRHIATPRRADDAGPMYSHLLMAVPAADRTRMGCSKPGNHGAACSAPTWWFLSAVRDTFCRAGRTRYRRGDVIRLGWGLCLREQRRRVSVKGPTTRWSVNGASTRRARRR